MPLEGADGIARLVEVYGASATGWSRRGGAPQQAVKTTSRTSVLRNTPAKSLADTSSLMKRCGSSGDRRVKQK